jgi:hypothetical protein
MGPYLYWNPNLYANASETVDNDAYSCKYAQEDKCAIRDGHSNLPETLDASLASFNKFPWLAYNSFLFAAHVTFVLVPPPPKR